jgi:NAD-dependent deacetylase
MRDPHAAAPATDVDLATIAGWLRSARSIVVLAGAGISTESGIRDFRGPNGVWTTNPDAERTATIGHYVADPEVRRQAWQNRANGAMLDAEPNAGHFALAELERCAALDVLITQNIDGLHHRAGSTPERIVEIHGNIREVKCLSCRWRGPMDETLARVRAGETDPTCHRCGGLLKSATVSFGEALDPGDLRRAQRAAARADVFVAVGTSLAVYPVAALPDHALANRARLVIMNAEPTSYDRSAHAIQRGRLGEILPELVALV